MADAPDPDVAISENGENPDPEPVDMAETGGEGENKRNREGTPAGPPGLNELQQLLSPVAGKWYPIGLHLNFSGTTLHGVESERDQGWEYYLTEMLKLWLERTEPPPSWAAIATALRAVEENSLAEQVESQYGCTPMEEERDGEGEGEGEGKEEGKVDVPDYKTQKEEIHVLLQQRLKKGDIWYLVDVRWLKQWKKYVGYDQWDQYSAGQQSANPGPLDNSNIFKDRDTDSLKDHLMEELDYALLPESAWAKLMTWYRLSEGSRPIQRKVVEYGLYMKHCKVEVYLLEFKLCVHPKMNEIVTRKFSRADTIADLEKALRSAFTVEEEVECRVWHRYMTQTYELLSDPKQSLQDAGLYNGQTIVLEKKNEDGSWPRAAEKHNYSTHPTRSTDNPGSSSSASGTSYGSSSSSYSYYWSGYSQQPSTPGLCGLSNLGNTCFMNSALQCLSNTHPLIEYFVASKSGYKPYKKHVNKDNPLGMGGAIAEAYGSLLEDIWSGKFNCVAPRQFKTQVGRYAPQFVGYAQHDSQELLAFLLDGLHEDLNLVKKKPYVDMTVKTKDRNDAEVAEESWYKYLQRNQSMIVKVFQGQLKSTLVCPDCHNVSKIFDPFMFLSLPLPYKKTRNILVSIVRDDPTAEILKYKVRVPKRGCVADLKRELSKLTDIATEMMVLVDVYNSRFHRIYDGRESLSHILERDDIFVYELTKPLNDPDWVYVPVYQREEVVRQVQYSYQSYTQRYHHLFGLPLVVCVPRQSCTYQQLYRAIMEKCSRYVCSWTEAKDTGVQQEEENKQQESESKDPVAMEIEEQGKKENEEGSAVDRNVDGQDNNVPDNRMEEEGGEQGRERESEGGREEEREEEEEEKVEEKEKKEMELFELVVVNSYGSQDVRRLKTSTNNALKLNNQTYIACDWPTEVKEKCYDLEAAEDIKEHESCREREREKKNLHLLDCLKLFTDEEILSKDDAWYCPSCKEFVQASKKFDLWKLPEILVVHLKRFSYDRYWRDKLDVMIEFPVSGLNLMSYVKNPDDPEALYDLFAITNHFGGMGGGHYTAYCKNKETGKWYNFDDSHVSETTEDRIVTSAAYVLFYQRRTEGHPVRQRPPLDRTLSQSFSDELRQKEAKFQGNGEGKERKRARNESGSKMEADTVPEEVFEEAPEDLPEDTSTSKLEETD